MSLSLSPVEDSNPDPVPFNDLTGVNLDHLDRFSRVLDRAVETSGFIGGPVVEEFERRWADYCDTEHAIGVANGTDAIELVLRGLGIGTGDEVVVPANTFVATAGAVVAAGATPVFADVDPGTLLMTEDTCSAVVGSDTAAIIAVHLYGRPVDMAAVHRVALRHGLAVIEDAAQAHGARYQGLRVGSLARAGTFSFYPGKNLGALGDGGAVTTDDASLAARIRTLANHGRSRRPANHVEVGRNSRLDAIQAGFLDAKLDDLDGQNARRSELADRYRRQLADHPIDFVTNAPDARSVYHLLVAQVDNRDRFRRFLADRGVETSIHYPTPCHRQPAYERFSRGYLPIAERAADRIVSLPLFPTMTEAQVDRVCRVAVAALVEGADR